MPVFTVISLQNNIMIFWKAVIEKLNPDAIKTISYTIIKKHEDVPFYASDILIYNNEGDLIAINSMLKKAFLAKLD